MNKPLPLIKSHAPGPLIKGDFEIQGSVNKRKTRNTTWSHLGVILGVILGWSQKYHFWLILYVYNWSPFGGSRFERKWMIPKMTPKMTQLISPVSQKRINKVLAKLWYISGLFDSKWIVTNIVFRKNENQGGTRLLIRGGDYIYIYIYNIHVYTYIYIYI